MLHLARAAFYLPAVAGRQPVANGINPFDLACRCTPDGGGVMVSFISPFAAERRMARELLEPGEFFEVHVDTPLAVAEARNSKGLNATARRRRAAKLTGIDSPYEAPADPELRIDTSRVTVDDAVDAVVALLAAQGVPPSP